MSALQALARGILFVIKSPEGAKHISHVRKGMACGLRYFTSALQALARRISFIIKSPEGAK